MITLVVEKRKVSQKPSQVRSEGKIPAVFYGRKMESTPVSIPQSEFSKAWREAGESTVLTLSLEGKTLPALVHDVQVDPVRGVPTHADFYVIEADRKVEVSVPLVFEGVSPAVKEKGGTLVKVLHEIEVKGLPKDLPQEIKIDIGLLTDFESQIVIKDIAPPTGIVFLAESEEVVAAISVAEEEKEEVTFDASQIEVEKKGKEDGAEEGAEESEGAGDSSKKQE
jgi:large subunit ribosomal protein L25